MNSHWNISLLKIFAALMLIISCGKAFSAEAVQCRHLLMTEGTTDSAIIAEFARLKFDLDRAKAHGNTIGTEIDMSKSLARSYDRKIAEFINASGGRMTESQLKEMIRDEIRKIQKLPLSNKKAQEVERRQAEQDSIKLNRFKFAFYDRIERPEFATVNPELFAEYVREAESFFWLVPNKNDEGNASLGYSLKRFDLEKESTSTERDDVTAMTLMKDPNLGLIMTRSGNTEIVDLRTMIVQHRVETKLSTDRVLNFATDQKSNPGIVAVNESGSALAVSEGWKVYFFDIQSGKYLGAFEDPTGFNSFVANIRFISDREVVFNKAGSLVKMDIDSHDKKIVEIFKTVGVRGLETSRDGKTISMMDSSSVTTINSSDLSIDNSKVIFTVSGGSSTRLLKRVIGSEDLLIHIGGRDQSRVGIYFQNQMTEASFDFGKYPIHSFQGMDVLTISIAENRSKAIVVGLDKKVPFLDIWKYTK